MTTGTYTFDTCAVTGVNNTAGTGPTAVTTDYTHVGSGVFTIAKPVGAVPEGWAVPGARAAVLGSNGQICQFNVTAVTESGGNTVITTDLGGPFPTSPSGWGPSVTVAAVQATEVFATACTGHDQFVQLSWPAAQGLPLNSYFKRTFTEASTNSVTGLIVGRMVSYSINVTLAYAGATSTVKIAPAQFHEYGTLHTTYAAYDFTPSINAKIAGARVFTPGTTTGTQTGDTSMTAIANPSPWLSRQNSPFLTGSVADGTVTIVFEITCDQTDSP